MKTEETVEREFDPENVERQSIDNSTGTWFWDDSSNTDAIKASDYDALLKLYRAASTPEAAGRGDGWISVAERVPEDETPVLYVVVPRGGDAYVKFGERSYDAGAECFWWCDSDGNFTEEGNEPGFSVVTHWQPIPAPPSGELAAVSEHQTENPRKPS